MTNELMAPHGWIALLLLWILFFWLYRDYRLDLFRQRMFALRDELFDIAHSGDLPFSSPAYGMLRSVINGNLQFGHQLGFLELLFFSIFGRRKGGISKVNHFEEKWANACKSISPDAQKKLQQIRTRMHVLVFDQLIFTSFTLIVSMIALLLVVLALIAKKSVIQFLERMMRRMQLSNFLAQLECSATTGSM